MSSGEVKLSVLPPVQTKGMTSESVGALCKQLHEQMQNESDRLNKLINLDEKYITLKKTE